MTRRNDQMDFDLEADAARLGENFSSAMLEDRDDDPDRAAFGGAVHGPDLTPADLIHSYPVKGVPRSHQVRALNEAGLKAAHCFFVDPGGGKTFLSIAEMGAFYERGEIGAALIFAPNGVHAQWIVQQLPQWCPLDYHATHSDITKRRMTDFLDRCGPYRLNVLAVNYETVRTTSGRRLIQAFVDRNPSYMLIVDESHKAKSHTAKTTKEAMWWALGAKVRRVLSGTPILRGLEDLWAQYEICKPGLAWPHEPIARRNGKVNTYGILGFRTHFCVEVQLPNNPRAKMIKGYRNEAELRARAAPYVTRVKSSEFAVMAEPDVITRHVPMTAEQERAYNAMKDMLITQIDGGVVTADNALVQMGKLMQIAAGFLYREGDGPDPEWETLPSTKSEVAIDLLRQLDEPVIVWTPFRAQRAHFLRACRDALGPDRPVFEYQVGGGPVTDWQATENGILVGNQGSSMGVGLNLQHAAANIYLSNTFSAEARWQSIKRTDRIGQTRQVRVWDLIAPGTLEERVMAALARKEEIARRNIDGLRELIST